MKTWKALQPVILAGGAGTRLWPLSRERHPKQFLPLMGAQTLFQETVGRLDGMEGSGAPIVVCNEAHRFLSSDQLREVGKEPSTIIVEPEGRNTAPALSLAALWITDSKGLDERDPVMLIMPADHRIRDTGVFQRTVESGFSLALAGNVVSFGVVPDRPATGYGYIRVGEALPRQPGDGDPTEERPEGGLEVPAGGPRHLSAFVEKPDAETAREFVDSGEYWWNSGIFMMRGSVWLSELERHRPDIASACRSAYARGAVDGMFYRPGVNEFLSCPKESIDYAVMEKASRGQQAGGGGAGYVVLALEAGWTDVGAWSALWEERDQDGQGNVVQGDVYTDSTRDALLIAQHRLLATVGLEDVVVVETPDAVLVASKERVQDVREIVARLQEEGRSEHEEHRKVHRPWGTYETVDSGEGFQVKRLTVNPGAALSMQRHFHRAEHWVVVKGRAKVTKGDEVFTLEPNQSTYVSKGTLHRLENVEEAPLEIIEVQSGSYLGEDDVERVQDDYDRS